MGNILTAISVIISNSLDISKSSKSDGVQNRVNQMGEDFEQYIKNAFANCLGKDERTVKHERNVTFSYLGNTRNPPDAMLRGGDAIEIKKIKNLSTSQLQLNSSYPKNKIKNTNKRICKKCRDSEVWDIKDMLYVIGVVANKTLSNILFIYGDIYCDDCVVYEKVENIIKESINSIDNVEQGDTNELGRINKVDHLGISDLRVRGMWLIESPFKYFRYLYDDTHDEHSFSLMAIIPETKYNSFENRDEFEEICKYNGVQITDEKLENPQNPAELINCKVIKYFI
mgnify:FL=1